MTNLVKLLDDLSPTIHLERAFVIFPAKSVTHSAARNEFREKNFNFRKRNN